MGHKTAPAFLGVASLLHVLLHVVVRMLGVMPDSLRAGDIDAKLDVGVSIEIQLLVLVVGEVDLEACSLWKENGEGSAILVAVGPVHVQARERDSEFLEAFEGAVEDDERAAIYVLEEVLVQLQVFFELTSPEPFLVFFRDEDGHRVLLVCLRLLHLFDDGNGADGRELLFRLPFLQVSVCGLQQGGEV